MRFRAPHIAAVAALALAAACATAGESPDAGGGGNPDASVGTPDAPIGFPDAPTGTPDARELDSPDAAPGTPDAMPATPDAMPATPDAAPGSPDAGCSDTIVQLLTNGNFDAGATDWTENGAGYPIILSTNDATYPLPVTPHTGDYAAWLGGVDSATRNVYQDVAIPAGATNVELSGMRYIATEELSTTVDYDTFTVTLRDTSNTVLETGPVLGNTDADASWIAWLMTPTGNYAGQTVRVHLESVNDVTNNTNFFIDTVALRVTVCQ